MSEAERIVGIGYSLARLLHFPDEESTASGDHSLSPGRARLARMGTQVFGPPDARSPMTPS